jgi:uncharacterized protein involved in exopolysaccharide biosynthesis
VKTLENYKREFLFVIFAQKTFIAKVTVISVLFSVLIAFFWPKSYSASGSILVRAKKAEMAPDLLQPTDLKAYPVTTADLFSELEILTSREVVEKSLAAVGTLKLDEKTSQKISRFSTISATALKRHIKTELIPGSNVVRVSFFWNDPDISFLFLETLLHQYLSYRSEVFNPLQEESFFANQLERFEKNIEKKQQELLDLLGEIKATDPRGEINNFLHMKGKLELNLRLLNANLVDKKKLLEFVDKTIESEVIVNFLFPGGVFDRVFDASLGELYFKRSEIVRGYDAESEQLKGINKQIDSIIRGHVLAYRELLQNEIYSMTERIKSLAENINEIDNRLVQLKKTLFSVKRKEKELDLLNFSYETFYRRNEEAKINSVVSASNLPLYVSIVSKPSLPVAPVFPRKGMIIPLGFLMGLIVGCMVGFVREFLDHTFKKPSDVEVYGKLPVICSIPECTSH